MPPASSDNQDNDSAEGSKESLGSEQSRKSSRRKTSGDIASKLEAISRRKMLKATLAEKGSEQVLID